MTSGLAQVNGCRGETTTLEDMKRRVDYDLEYLRHWNWPVAPDSNSLSCDDRIRQPTRQRSVRSQSFLWSSEAVWNRALDFDALPEATSPGDIALRDVLTFHGAVQNGGLVNAIEMHLEC